MRSSSLVPEDRELLCCLSLYLGQREQPLLSTGRLDLVVEFHVSLLGAWICSPPSQPGFAPLVEAAEEHHRLVEGKSFVSLKLRKQLWKQRPQNNPKQGQVL